MKPLTTAQRLLMALGVEPMRVIMGHHVEKSRSHTKKGSGRRHQQGKRKQPD